MLYQASIRHDRLATVAEEMNRAYDEADYERIHRLIITETSRGMVRSGNRTFLPHHTSAHQTLSSHRYFDPNLL
ncbi:hypothetical protein A6F49_08045 [Enteractinococcus helveticum]|uniref:Uncharacterized protein n=1 Tax=Enteractinococcus helveticum TaxID=1837282 RepID=A0A1B7M0S3_9MICC|nr:hypothetical protein A6F49_08045 [Enteractinococcus helveticum]